MDVVLCGPLLRYTYIDHQTRRWNGSLLLVLGRTPVPPSLHLEYGAQSHTLGPKNIFSERGHSFWRYSLNVQLIADEQQVTFAIDDLHICGSFYVPGNDQTMRVMFHSCNGFSVKIPQDAFAGPSLWNDVLRVHAEHPFHVMIGGGDQIYSDRVCVDGPLKSWATDLKPRHRARTPFTPQLSRDLDEWYFNNYIDWFAASPFCKAGATIPTLQIWDDHDIIDGYGSYQDRFMRSPVFLGIGKVAYKYYLLFQQHTPPYMFLASSSEIQDPDIPDPSFALGSQPGPYIPSVSMSLCTTLGPRTVFFGLDCRVERTYSQICYPSTYDAMFARLQKEVIKGRTKHLVLLLGVPVAYPRLVWLEGILKSSMIAAPIKLANKLFGIGGGAFNKFDGASELLDDLNDHWCAVTHKHERNGLVRRLQDFVAAKQVRLTILSGDVHLAAVGRFFSSPRLKVPQNKDPRYMVNVISSAITNAPPPTAVARLIHRRNRMHFLDRHTHENLMALFREGVDGSARKFPSTMPARNYVIITEQAGLGAQTLNQNGHIDGDAGAHDDLRMARDEDGGTIEQDVSAAASRDSTTRPYALDVAFRVEIDPKDPDGKTKGYGFSIPALEN